MSNNQIMIVEDDIISAEGLKAKLQDMGYPEPYVIHSGEDAVKMAVELQPDLILMDIKLFGELDGIDAAQKIQHSIDKPIIYLTSYSDEAIMQRAKITAPFSYMVKPVRERELHITIEMALYRHKMEQQLKMREKWLDTVLKSIGDAVIATDTQARITFMNNVAEVLTGWSIQDASGRNLVEIFNIVNNSTGAPAENPAIRALKEGRIVGLANNTALIRRDGSRIIIDDSASPIQDDKGIIKGAVLIFRDVTEQKKSQIQIEETAVELDTIFNNAPALMMLIDRKGTVYRVNKYAMEDRDIDYIIGQQAGDIIKCVNAMSIAGCGNGPDCPYCPLRNMFINSFDTGIPIKNAEIVMSTVNENIKYPKTLLVSCKILPMGAKDKALITINDITDKKQLKQALEESEKKYASIIEMAGEAIIFGKDRLTEYNRKAVEMFGLTDSPKLSETSVFMLSPEQQPDGDESYKKYTHLTEETLKGEPQYFEWQFKKADGTLFDAEVALSKVEVDNQPMILSIIRDITERKRAEGELRNRTEELEIFNKVMVDREMRIIELKEEVNILCRHLGQKPIYDPVWQSESKMRKITYPEIY
ncbi:MAG: PAS domain S-box protein [Firmicutes bacterium]|nr:PAS domain S-box protein [Bacillota bacterium]